MKRFITLGFLTILACSASTEANATPKKYQAMQPIVDSGEPAEPLKGGVAVLQKLSEQAQQSIRGLMPDTRSATLASRGRALSGSIDSTASPATAEPRSERSQNTLALGVSSGSYGVQSGSWGVKSGSYGAQSGSWGVKSGSYGVQSGSWGVKSGSYGVQSGSWGVKSGSYGAQSGSWGVKSGSYGAQSGSWGLDSGSWGIEIGSWLANLSN